MNIDIKCNGGISNLHFFSTNGGIQYTHIEMASMMRFLSRLTYDDILKNVK
jgi:hypothetical protein